MMEYWKYYVTDTIFGYDYVENCLTVVKVKHSDVELPLMHNCESEHDKVATWWYRYCRIKLDMQRKIAEFVK